MKLASQARTAFANDLVSLYERLTPNAPMAGLGTLLAFLRAEVWMHQAHHWQTRGCSSYGDHLLFDRLYSDANLFVDGLAEKAVGTGQHLLVHPGLQANGMLECLRVLYGNSPVNPSAEAYPGISLQVVERMIEFTNLVYSQLESKGELSHGIDNMLQGIVDKHEEFAYLLKQRCTSKTARKHS
jgi:hypothetical protein